MKKKIPVQFLIILMFSLDSPYISNADSYIVPLIIHHIIAVMKTGQIFITPTQNFFFQKNEIYIKYYYNIKGFCLILISFQVIPFVSCNFGLSSYEFI